MKQKGIRDEKGYSIWYQADCHKAKIGCVECKRMLGERIIEILEPIQKRREIISGRHSFVKIVLQNGKIGARASAQKTLAEVKEKMGLA